MTLKAKILTTLSSIAAVGIVIPTTVSCSCSKKDYIFNYGDQINCRDKKDDNYHKIKDVKKAAKIKAAKSERRDIDDSDINDINERWSTPQGIKLFFYDLVASAVVTNNEEINFKSWTVDTTTYSSVSFVWNGQTLQGEKLHYDHAEDNTIWLYLNSQFKYRSYTYYDCTYKQPGRTYYGR